MKEVEDVSETIEELRDKLIETTTMLLRGSKSLDHEDTEEYKQMKALGKTWSNFLKEWQGLKDKIKKDEEFENRTTDNGNKLSKLARIVKKI